MTRVWKKPTANFKTDLLRGKTGEAALLAAFGNTVTATDGRKGDMIISATGALMEIKTDYYPHDKTKNFFCERYSYDNQPGGVWQAAVHKAEFFVYMFADPGFSYIYRTMDFLRRMKQIEAQNRFPLIDIPNRGYTTRGYKVPRELFSDLELTWEQIDVKFNSKKYMEFIINKRSDSSGTKAAN